MIKNFFKIALRNLWRNKRRSLITMGSIVFAVMLSTLMDSVKKGLLDKMKDKEKQKAKEARQAHKAKQKQARNKKIKDLEEEY